MILFQIALGFWSLSEGVTTHSPASAVYGTRSFCVRCAKKGAGCGPYRVVHGRLGLENLQLCIR